MLNLQWQHISNGDIRIAEVKTGSAHTLPLSKVALQILKKQNTSTPNGFTLSPNRSNINNILKTWAKRAHINKNISFHCARHSFATQLISKGNDIYTVSKLLGHKNVTTTQIYARVVDSKKVEAIATLPDSL